MTQAPHHAPDEPIVRAIALKGEGYSVPHIAELIGHPERTVYGWLEREREAAEGNKPLLTKWTRRSLHALDLIGDGLDAIERDGDAKKHLTTLNIIAGTGTDKLQKETQPPTLQAQNVIYVFNAAQPDVPEAIEGTAVRVPDDKD